MVRLLFAGLPGLSGKCRRSIWRKRRRPVRLLSAVRPPTSGPPCRSRAKEAQKDLPSVRPGQAITHKAFGDGVVQACTPMGNDVLMEVKFAEGTKMMMLRTASQFITIK